MEQGDECYSFGQEVSVFPFKTMWALLENTGIRGMWRLLT